MALGVRQLALYTDTFSVYKPTNTSGASSIGTAKEPLYELLEAGVLGKYDPNKETSVLDAMGRMHSNAKAELEKIYTNAGQVIHDQYCIKLTTPSHPLLNTWFTVIGEPEIRASSGRRKSNYLHFYIKPRVKAPTIRP